MGEQRLTVEECRQRARDCADAAHAAAASERERLIRQANDWMILADAARMERSLRVMGLSVFAAAIVATALLTWHAFGS